MTYVNVDVEPFLSGLIEGPTGKLRPLYAPASSWWLDALNYSGTPGTADRVWRYHESDRADLWTIEADPMVYYMPSEPIAFASNEATAQDTVARLNAYPEPFPS